MNHLLPIRLLISSTGVSVRWMRFDISELTDPFFHQSIRRLRRLSPQLRFHDTSLSSLIESARSLPRQQPAGLILHVSRCGSTLLANSLRRGKNVVVLSEASIFSALFRLEKITPSPFLGEYIDDLQRDLIDSVVSLYCHHAFGASTKLVLKAYAVSIMQIPLLRKIWPRIPIVILIRNPVEVVVSNMTKPAGWLRAVRKREAAARGSVGSPRNTVEEDCARGLGSFFTAAHRNFDSHCRVLDYNNLDVTRICDVAEFFGIDLTDRERELIQQSRRFHAKDPRGSRPFEDDRATKQSVASEAIGAAVNKWAVSAYEILKIREAWRVN